MTKILPIVRMTNLYVITRRNDEVIYNEIATLHCITLAMTTRVSDSLDFLVLLCQDKRRNKKFIALRSFPPSG